MTQNFQVLSLDVLVYLRQHMPKDAFCTLAFTMEDLYPEENWNFVFGQASLNTGVGVFSFARYDPAFYGHARKEGYRLLLNMRCCKVLVHEIAHMFSLAHCTFFHCLMNGSNHLAESTPGPCTSARCLHSPVLHRLHVMERFRRSFTFTAITASTVRPSG